MFLEIVRPQCGPHANPVVDVTRLSRANGRHELVLAWLSGPAFEKNREFGLAIGERLLKRLRLASSSACARASFTRAISFSSSTSAGAQCALFRIEYAMRRSSGVLKYSSRSMRSPAPGKIVELAFRERFPDPIFRDAIERHQADYPTPTDRPPGPPTLKGGR